MGYMIGVDVGGTFTDFSIFHQAGTFYPKTRKRRSGFSLPRSPAGGRTMFCVISPAGGRTAFAR